MAGDLHLAQAANASLYSLRSSIRSEVHHGLSPGGLTTNGYNGHTFWDQESWMLVYALHVHTHMHMHTPGVCITLAHVSGG